MTVLVTGGAGFIGSHVSEALLERGNRVVCVDDFNDYYDPALKEANVRGLVPRAGYRLVRGDIRDKTMLSRIFQEERPDTIIHLAARAGVRPSIDDPHIYTSTNVDGTVNLLELAHQQGIKDVVLASSSSVYGNAKKTPFSEEDAPSPISPYAASKLATEAYARTYATLWGMNTACLRFFTVYGPRGRPDMAPALFMRRIMDAEPITLYGDGATSRDYTYIGDIVDGVLRAADRNVGYEVINLGNSHPVSLLDFVSTMERVVGKKALVRHAGMQKGDVERTYADISKARELLQWEPHTPLEEGLSKQYAYLRS